MVILNMFVHFTKKTKRFFWPSVPTCCGRGNPSHSRIPPRRISDSPLPLPPTILAFLKSSFTFRQGVSESSQGRCCRKKTGWCCVYIRQGDQKLVYENFKKRKIMQNFFKMAILIHFIVPKGASIHHVKGKGFIQMTTLQNKWLI